MYDELKYWHLRDHKLFWTLSSEQIRQLCIIFKYKKVKKGETIHFVDDDIPKIFFLKKGAIKIVSINEQGEETIKDILQKGDLFGELTFERDENVNEYAKALTDDVTICSFLRDDFEAFMLRNPHMALNYTKFIGLRMKRISNNYNNLISKDAKSRLLLFLIEWAQREGAADGNRYAIENYLTQNDIAQIICTSRQTIAALVKELETDALIGYNRQEIVIYDLPKLQAMCK